MLLFVFVFGSCVVVSVVSLFVVVVVLLLVLSSLVSSLLVFALCICPQIGRVHELLLFLVSFVVSFVWVLWVVVCWCRCLAFLFVLPVLFAFSAAG